jgi:hypothetical protein
LTNDRPNLILPITFHIHILNRSGVVTPKHELQCKMPHNFV